MLNIWCGQYAKYGYRLHVGHPVLGKLYDHFRITIGLGLMACSPAQRLIWEEVVMAYYSALYKKQWKRKPEFPGNEMQWLRFAEIIEYSDIEAAKAAITAKAVEKLRKDGKNEESKAVEAC